MGPRDRQALDLLQPPLDYPGIVDHTSDPLSLDGVASRRARRKRVADVDAGQSKRSLTPEQKVRERDLEIATAIGPIGSGSAKDLIKLMPVPSTQAFHVYVEVRWYDQGREKMWPDSRIHVRYGPVADGNTADGSGPHTFRPSFQQKSLVISVDLWNEKRQRWIPEKVSVQEIVAYCAADMTALSEEEQEVAATLFGEGGSSMAVTEDELHRLAWTMRNRVDIIKQYEDAAAANPNDSLTKSRLRAVHRDFGSAPTYKTVLSKTQQFDGYGGDNYDIAKEPAKRIKSADSCDRLHLTMSVAVGVVQGAIPDPYSGKGNAKAPSSFFFITKDDYAKRVKENKVRKKKQQALLFAPEWDKLPSQESDRHFFWGMKPEVPFKP